jgi:hypothetical protein
VSLPAERRLAHRVFALPAKTKPEPDIPPPPRDGTVPVASAAKAGLSPLLPYGRSALACYVAGMALITIAAVWLASETRHRTL